MLDVSEPIPELTTAIYSAQLLDENEVPMLAEDLEELTLAYYDLDTEAIINGRDFQDALNANDIAISTTGLLEWTMQPEDTVVLNEANAYEIHVALFSWVTIAGVVGRHEARLTIRNFALVP